jgi:hypothetical protein
VCKSILRDATNVVKEGKLCKFYLNWKLHKSANAAGIRTRPIAAAINNWPCITFSTFSTAAGSLEAQECLQRLARFHSNFREFQRHVRNQTNNSRCSCPLPLDICVERSRPATQTRVGSWYLTVAFKPYRKPGNAHAYIPFTSFHARHTFRGWVLAELLRLLTHSSTVEIWQEEGEFFYHYLCSRGYPREFLRAVFEKSHGDGGLGYWSQSKRSERPSSSRLTGPVC